METPYSGNEHPFSNEELRMAELLHQFLALSDDQDCAGRITFRGPSGEFLGEAKLSARDVEAATTALESLNACREAMEESTEDDALLMVDQADADRIIAGFEKLLSEGGA